MTDPLVRWRRLCERAAQRDVVLFIGYEIPGVDSSHWDGLWLDHEKYGTGIALSPALDIQSAVWVFAHELGHEYTHNQNRLISPFFGAAAHISTLENRKRWGRGQVLERVEAAANLWGACDLVSAEEWVQVEALHPGSFEDMATWLQLPVEAVLWRAKAEKPGQEPERVVLTRSAKRFLLKAVNGEGGPQTLLRRLQGCLRGQTLNVTHKDFYQVREYAYKLGGGWGDIFKALLGDFVKSVDEAGGMHRCFRSA